MLFKKGALASNLLKIMSFTLFRIKRVIQGTTLDDHTVHTKAQWDAAVNFLEDALYARIKEGKAFLPATIIVLLNSSNS